MDKTGTGKIDAFPRGPTGKRESIAGSKMEASTAGNKMEAPPNGPVVSVIGAMNKVPRTGNRAAAAASAAGDSLSPTKEI